MIATVKAVIGMTTMPQARKIFRVCAFQGFTRNLTDLRVLPLVLNEHVSLE